MLLTSSPKASQAVDAGEEADAAAEQMEVKAVQEDENEEDEEGNEETALAAAASPLPHVAPKPKQKRSVQWAGKPLDNQAAGGNKFHGCAPSACPDSPLYIALHSIDTFAAHSSLDGGARSRTCCVRSIMKL